MREKEGKKAEERFFTLCKFGDLGIEVFDVSWVAPKLNYSVHIGKN